MHRRANILKSYNKMGKEAQWLLKQQQQQKCNIKHWCNHHANQWYSDKNTLEHIWGLECELHCNYPTDKLLFTFLSQRHHRKSHYLI